MFWQNISLHIEHLHGSGPKNYTFIFPYQSIYINNTMVAADLRITHLANRTSPEKLPMGLSNTIRL